MIKFRSRRRTRWVPKKSFWQTVFVSRDMDPMERIRKDSSNFAKKSLKGARPGFPSDSPVLELILKIRAHNAKQLESPATECEILWNSLWNLKFLKNFINPVNLTRNHLWIIDDKWLNISELYNLPGINLLNLKRFQTASVHRCTLYTDRCSLSFSLWNDFGEIQMNLISLHFSSNSTRAVCKQQKLRFIQAFWNKFFVKLRLVASFRSCIHNCWRSSEQRASRLHHHSEWIILQLLSVGWASTANGGPP